MSAIAIEEDHLIIDGVRVPIRVAKAAPEMLVALRLALPTLEHHAHEHKGGFTAWETVRAAIAEATGEI